MASLIVAAAIAFTASFAVAQTVTFENDTQGKPPKDFEFGLAGEGGPGRWEVVADKTAAGGKALAQLSTNTAANRFLVAIYNRPSSPMARSRLAASRSPAGSIRPADSSSALRTRRNYYIARSNALESNVRFYRVRNGERQQLATAENVKTPRGQWHTLTLRAEGNRYTVSVNGKTLHTTTDTIHGRAAPDRRPRRAMGQVR